MVSGLTALFAAFLSLCSVPGKRSIDCRQSLKRAAPNADAFCQIDLRLSQSQATPNPRRSLHLP